MKTLKYEPLGGETIQFACAIAVEKAVKENVYVEFEFNGHNISVNPQSDPKQLASDYMADCQRKHEDYKASPKGILEKQLRDAEVKKNQQNIDSLIAEIADSALTMDDLMQWLKQFSISADFIGVNVPLKYAILGLEKHGFKSNDHVGQSPEWFSTRERMGQYIAGQAISCMENKMPPHPMTQSFVEKYFKLP
jgi:hypothetical protein